MPKIEVCWIARECKHGWTLCLAAGEKKHNRPLGFYFESIKDIKKVLKAHVVFAYLANTKEKVR